MNMISCCEKMRYKEIGKLYVFFSGSSTECQDGKGVSLKHDGTRGTLSMFEDVDLVKVPHLKRHFLDDGRRAVRESGSVGQPQAVVGEVGAVKGLRRGGRCEGGEALGEADLAPQDAVSHILNLFSNLQINLCIRW